MGYSYETYPGQTIVRTTQGGYSKDDILQELKDNCDGVIVTDEEREDSFTRVLAGKSLRNCRLQFSDHGAGRRSVQIFQGDQLALDIDL